MIKFFRRIRQNLLSEGKTGKYLKYAIGEIVLVVIGILIALSINNWNQERSQRNEEKIILSTLKADFESAIKELNLLNIDRERIQSGAIAFNELEQKDLVNHSIKHLDSLMFMTMNAPTFNNQSGSLNVLLTSGKINLISNQDLKEKLIQWPGDVEDMAEDEINHSRYYLEEYIPIVGNHVSWNGVFKQMSYISNRFNTNPMTNLKANPNMASDYKSLIADRAFLNALYLRTVFCQISTEETNELIEKARDIIDLIENNS